MATTHLHGNPVPASGELPAKGSKATDFHLTDKDLADFAGKRKALNIFPSIDTPTCAQSVRTFNARASEKPDTVALCISADLPFAHAYGAGIAGGPLAGLCARAVVVLDKDNPVQPPELVNEIAHEPNYDAALAAL